jgi:hypothetical protein
VDAASVMSLFEEPLLRAFDEQDRDLKEYVAEAFSDQDSREFLPGLADATGAQDQYEIDNAAGFGRIKAVFDANMTDVKVFKVGPKDDRNPNELASDQGAYQYIVVGKTAGGKVAGVMFESVET